MDAKPVGTPPQAPKKRMIDVWPDLSDYGLYFGFLDIAAGRHLVMIDETGSWDHYARRIGFARTRYAGIWMKKGGTLELPDRARLFPRARFRTNLEEDAFLREFKARTAARREMRLSQANSNRFSWHPNRLPSRAATAVANLFRLGRSPVAAPAPELPISAIISQNLYLGYNHLGQEVYEGSDGIRYTRIPGADKILSRESERKQPEFLRSTTPEDLVLVAAGLVTEIQVGRNLKSEDFERYVRTSMGEAALDNEEAIQQFHLALDEALFRHLTGIAPTASPEGLWQEALRLHEGRPSFWRRPGTLPTPLPIGVALHQLVTAHSPEGEHVRLDVGGTRPMHSFGGQDSTAPTAVHLSAADAIPPHAVAVGGVFLDAIEPRVIAGTKVSRQDHATVISALEKRTADGVSAFLIGATSAGKLDMEARRIVNFIGSRYEILGLADLDPHMIAIGNTTPSRLLVVGKRLAEINHAFATPVSVPVFYDYGNFHTFIEQLRLADGSVETFGADAGSHANRWQAPYIPSSQVSEPEAMSPRNLLGPVRKALADLIDKTGMGIDEYVSERLGWTLDELAARLSAEQVDAVALALRALEKRGAFVQGSQTGMGKGRTLGSIAVAMAVAIAEKRPVLFLTKTPNLFRDFYRDLNDIGCMEHFANPLILNADEKLITEDGTLIARSPKKDVRDAIMNSLAIPPNTNLVVGTFSQFNQKAPLPNAIGTHKAAKAALEVLRAGGERLAALQAWNAELKARAEVLFYHDVLDDPLLAGLTQTADAVLALQAIPTPAATRMIERLGEDEEKFLAGLAEHLLPSAQLRQAWLHEAARDCVLILDESHEAAGQASNTSANVTVAVENAAMVCYSSATAFKNVRSFGIYGPIFPKSVNRATIAETLDRGGAPMQEIMAACLAADGVFFRAEHDLSNIEFRTMVDLDRRERNVAWADAMSDVLAAMVYLSDETENLARTMTKTRAAALKKAKTAGQTTTKATMGVQYTNFSSRFFSLRRMFQMVIKADYAAEQAVEALKRGLKPVIASDATMEAPLRDLLLDLSGDEDAIVQEADKAVAEVGQAEAGEGDDTIDDAAADKIDGIVLGRKATFRDILHRYLDNMFYAWDVKKQGNKVLSRKRISLLKPEMAEAVAEIREMINAMPDIPLSPLDMVKKRIEAAGHTVGEISGRKISLDELPDGTSVIRKLKLPERNKTIDAYNYGLLDAVVITRSAMVGCSMHASERWDPSQRELIVLDSPRDVAMFLQMLGRVNRKGQCCHPLVAMLSSGLPTEHRMILMHNRNMRMMSASISGNSDNANVDENTPDILNSIGNEVCYRFLEGNPEIAKRLSIDIFDMGEEEVELSGTRFVDRLTGRIELLRCDEQADVYRRINNEFNSLLLQKEIEGQNPLKPREFDLKAKITRRELVHVPPACDDSVFDEPVYANEITYTEVSRPYPPEKIMAEIDAAIDGLEARFGNNEAPHRALIRTLSGRAREIMKNILPKRFTTLEQALAEEGANAIKNFRDRIAGMADLLPDLMPGAVFRLTNGLLGDTEYIVVGLSIPDEQYGMCTPSEYSIKCRTPGSDVLTTFDLSALLKMRSAYGPLVPPPEGKNEDPAAPFALSRQNFLKLFDETRSRERTCITFEGNLFAAAELSSQLKMGTTVTYTDEHGLWHHAVMMPSHFRMADALVLPVALSDNDGKMLAAFLRAHPTERVSDTLRREDMKFSVYGTTVKDIQQHRFEWYGSAEQLAAIATPALQATLESAIGGDRGSRSAVINAEKLDAFAAELVRLVPGLIAPGKHRPWAHDFAEEARRQAQQLGETSLDITKEPVVAVEDALASIGIAP